MATTKKHATGKFTVSHGLSLMNDFISNVEGEFDKALKTAKKNVNGLIANIDPEDMKKRAVVKLNATLADWQKQAVQTKNQVWSALKIPSHSEIVTLTRKVSALEKRLDALKSQGARH